MKSKAVVFACMLLLVSAVVLAFAEGNQEQPQNAEGVNKNGVEESKLHCYHGCCKYYGHNCVKCCGSVAEAKANAAHNNNNNAAQEEGEVETAGHRWGGGGGGGGGHRGGGGGGGHRGGGGGGWGGGGKGEGGRN